MLGIWQRSASKNETMCGIGDRSGIPTIQALIAVQLPCSGHGRRAVTPADTAHLGRPWKLRGCRIILLEVH